MYLHRILTLEICFTLLINQTMFVLLWSNNFVCFCILTVGTNCFVLKCFIKIRNCFTALLVQNLRASIVMITIIVHGPTTTAGHRRSSVYVQSYKSMAHDYDDGICYLISWRFTDPCFPSLYYLAFRSHLLCKFQGFNCARHPEI